MAIMKLKVHKSYHHDPSQLQPIKVRNHQSDWNKMRRGEGLGGQSAKFCNLHHNHRDHHHNCHDHHYNHQDNDQSRKGGRSVGLGVSQQKIIIILL